MNSYIKVTSIQTIHWKVGFLLAPTRCGEAEASFTENDPLIIRMRMWMYLNWLHSWVKTSCIFLTNNFANLQSPV